MDHSNWKNIWGLSETKQKMKVLEIHYIQYMASLLCVYNPIYGSDI